MFKTGKRCGELVITFMLVLSLTPFFTAQSVSHASETVLEASTLEEFIEATSGVTPEIEFTVNKEDGSVGASDDFNSVFDEDFDKIKNDEEKVIETIEDSGKYTVIGSTEDSYEVAETFGSCRILVNEEVKSSEGAKSAVSYNDMTVLTYGSPSKAEEVYKDLQDKYGEDNVVPDFPLSVVDNPLVSNDSTLEEDHEAGSMAYPLSDGTLMYAGWGTEHMGMDIKTQELKKKGNSSEVTVAVIDTGINPDHDNFKGKNISGYNIVKNKASDYADNDEYRHGSGVAGIIAESTPDNVNILAIKDCDDSGRAYFSDVLNAISYAATEGEADIINISGGIVLTKGRSVDSATAMKNFYDTTLEAAYDEGAVIVAATGNSNEDFDDVMVYPASSEYAYAVGAIDKKNARANFSNYGKTLDFVAPGVNLLTSADESDSYFTSSGTSFSAPHIAAAAALLKLEDKSRTQTDIYNELKRISVDLGDVGRDDYFGCGYPKFSETPREKSVITMTGLGINEAYDFRINGKNFTFDNDNKSMTYDAHVGDELLFEYLPMVSVKKTTKLIGLVINDEVIDLNKYPDSYKYEVKDKKVDVEFQVKETLRSTLELIEEKANIIVESDKNGTVTINGKTQNSDEIYVGEMVKVGYIPNKDYEVESVTINGEAVDTGKYPSVYRFRIETETVDIKVRFAKKKASTQTVVDLSKAGFIKKIKAQPKNGFEYNGKPITIGAYVKPYYRNNALKEVALTNYTVKYTKNNQLGIATVTFTSKDTKAFKGSIKTTFKIIPRKTPWKKIVMTKNSAQITVKAVNGSPNYQYQIRLNGKGSWKTVNSKKTTYKFTKLKGGKNYQIRVRAYKKVGNTTYYGSWNTITKKTTKKTYKFR